MVSHPLPDRIPDQSLIKENDNVASERIQATRGNDYLFVYTAAGKPFNVVMGKIQGKQMQAYWYDPRNGKTIDIGMTENTGVKKFIPPSSGYGNDWVLVLDDAEKKFPKTS